MIKNIYDLLPSSLNSIKDPLTKGFTEVKTNLDNLKQSLVSKVGSNSAKAIIAIALITYFLG